MKSVKLKSHKSYLRHWCCSCTPIGCKLLRRGLLARSLLQATDFHFLLWFANSRAIKSRFTPSALRQGTTTATAPIVIVVTTSFACEEEISHLCKFQFPSHHAKNLFAACVFSQFLPRCFWQMWSIKITTKLMLVLHASRVALANPSRGVALCYLVLSWFWSHSD